MDEQFMEMRVGKERKLEEGKGRGGRSGIDDGNEVCIRRGK